MNQITIIIHQYSVKTAFETILHIDKGCNKKQHENNFWVAETQERYNFLSSDVPFPAAHRMVVTLTRRLVLTCTLLLTTGTLNAR